MKVQLHANIENPPSRRSGFYCIFSYPLLLSFWFCVPFFMPLSHCERVSLLSGFFFLSLVQACSSFSVVPPHPYLGLAERENKHVVSFRMPVPGCKVCRECIEIRKYLSRSFLLQTQSEQLGLTTRELIFLSLYCLFILLFPAGLQY